MSLPRDIIRQEPHWLDQDAPLHHVVVSTRGRYARNIAGHPFAPHADPPALEVVRAEVREAFESSATLDNFHALEMNDITGRERGFLKESRLISREMERGGSSRAVYVAHDLKCSIMINEEDHLRLQVLEPGLQVAKVYERLVGLEKEVGSLLKYSFHPHYGYLTACPSNVGTGVRISVMMHLPGLALRREGEKLLGGLGREGMTVRGFHGENSDYVGDFYQVSNEVTLGVTVEEIAERLGTKVMSIFQKEIEARSLLLTHGGVACQDTIWRSWGVLTNARRIDSTEAMKLLSRIRPGIDEGYFAGVTHERLNRLVAEIQPGHLLFRHNASDETEKRDIRRAELIREMLLQSASDSKD